MPLPDFVIIGAPRAATTAVHQWLGRHPDVCVSRPKETQFFSLHYASGTSFYDRFFQHRRGERVIGESTPVYLTLPYVPERIAATIPAARLVAILREPVEQAYSTWWMMRCLGAEQRSFEDALAAERDWGPLDPDTAEDYWRELLNASVHGMPVNNGRYLMTGHYVESIDRYRRHFADEQLTLLLHDDLVRHPEATVQRIADAVGVDASSAPSPRPPQVNRSAGRFESLVARRTRWVPSTRARHGLARAAATLDRETRPPLSPETRRELTRYFADVNRGLAERVGADVSHWFESVATS